MLISPEFAGKLDENESLRIEPVFIPHGNGAYGGGHWRLCIMVGQRTLPLVSLGVTRRQLVEAGFGEQVEAMTREMGENFRTGMSRREVVGGMEAVA